ncbi:MAG: hypothetical protein ACFFBV_10985 [Promethearchaeota archaeon]
MARHSRTLPGRRPWRARKHTVREPGDHMARLWGEGPGAALGSRGRNSIMDGLGSRTASQYRRSRRTKSPWGLRKPWREGG